MGAVMYKGIVLMKGSEAYFLHQSGDIQKLKAHMETVTKNYEKMHGISAFQPLVAKGLK